MCKMVNKQDRMNIVCLKWKNQGTFRIELHVCKRYCGAMKALYELFSIVPVKCTINIVALSGAASALVAGVWAGERGDWS